MKSNIALIGFMGVGKTAVGQALAEKLGREFVELDLQIKKKADKSIVEIFQQDDEITFRELEIEVTRHAAQKSNAVIACGGGIVLNQINIDRLRINSRIVYLTASPSAILKRIARGGERRPLLEVPDPASTVRELLKLRRPLYERAADIVIDTTRINIDAAVEQIIAGLKQDEDFNLRK
ncbi:MAG: shikimate kinase [Dehalococcoidia bacterium]|nr:shikimate kinase [Dehalococcoidia bacterium]MDD5493215.1 shikimate kinase [Dehalococcoidia bacterium]